MKKVIFIIGFLLLFGNGYSQWIWQNPHPVGSNLQSCFFTTSNTGYAVGWDGTIIKTTNGGVNWIQIYTGLYLKFYSIFFTNQYTGYVISGEEDRYLNNILLKTTDEGITWHQIYTFNYSHLNLINFINNNTGFIAGYVNHYGSILKTTNSGYNWIQYQCSYGNLLNSVYFINDSIGYAVGYGTIYKTSNTGENWIILNQGPPFYELNTIYFMNPNTGFIGGQGGWLFKTSNGGINWSLDSSTVHQDIWDIKFKDNNTGFFASGSQYDDLNGKIFRTTNSGLNWEIMQTYNSQNYRCISIVGNNILTVGYRGTVVKSTDNGFNWIDLSNSMTSYNLYDSYIFDSLKCIVVGDSCRVLTTSDGGNTWGKQNLGGNINLNSIYFANQNTGFVAGGFLPNYSSYAKVYKSTNGGLNWNLIYGFNNETGNIVSIVFTSALTGYFVGGDRDGPYFWSICKKTTDGGLNWYNQSLYSSRWLNSIYFINNNTGYICGDSGRIYKTTNAGNNWTNLISGITSDLYSITFSSDSTGYTAGLGNIILKTVNGGTNWNAYNINLLYNLDIKQLHFFNNNTGVLVGLAHSDYGGGDILTTSNGGLNWQHLSSVSTYPTYQLRGLNSIRFLNDKLGYIVGGKSLILKTTDGKNSIDIKNISIKMPQNFSLLQNYPNPFNPTTNIKYQIAKNSFVTLKVYDILGKEITTLVNEKLQPGEYEVQFPNVQVANVQLPSGVYFYKLVAGDFSETRKMILLK